MHELSHIRRLRKKLGLTQAELALKANVSQSLIAKIETGKIDPGYTSTKRIFEVLNALDKDNELTAKDIMHKRIVSVLPSDTLKQAIVIMRKKNISQMPVMDQGKVLGFISESVLLDKFLEEEHGATVKDIMQSSPPIVPPDTYQGVIANLLHHFPFVLVEEKGKLKGIIAKSDLLKAIY